MPALAGKGPKRRGAGDRFDFDKEESPLKTMEWNGQALSYLWKDGEGEKPSGLVICLAAGEEDAKACAQALEPQVGTAALAVVNVPETNSWESGVADLVYSWQLDAALDKCRLALTGSAASASAVWQLASHYPQWFSGVAVAGGCADPYQARNLKDVPLLVAVPAQESTCIREGRVLASASVTVAGMRAAGASHIQLVEGCEALTPEDAWNRAFSPAGGAASWLLAQDRRTQYMVTWLMPGVWRMDDFFSASCYLVEGKEKALLIDTGMGEGDLPALAASLTTLPVEVAITHPHLDHMHWIDCFSKVYLHEEDIPALQADPSKFPLALKDSGAPLPQLVPIREHSKIDLGGGVVLEVLDLPGHTPHSVVFADDAHRCLFTGDAMGSGDIVLLICPEKEALSLVARYRQALEEFLAYMPRLRQYAWLGGHSIQENGCDPRHQQDFLQGTSQVFNPLREQVVRDMIALCDGLLSGEIVWQQEPIHLEYHCQLGSAGINFRFT